MEKIKVFHVITLLELGGAQQNTLFTVAHLDRRRFDVGLICGQGAILDEEAKKIPDLKLTFLPSLVRPVRPVQDFLAVLRLASILRKERPDIVHTHSSKAGIVGRIAARWAGVPVVIHSIHGFGFNPYQKFFVRRLFVFLERWTARFTQTLIAVTRVNIEEGLDLDIGTIDQYELIRSGVDIEKIKQSASQADPLTARRALGLPADAKVVLNIGPFKIQKDPLAFVNLAKKVAARVPSARFLMVGDGELRPKIEECILREGLTEQVRLLGWRRDVPQILSLCDLFVMTSLWEGLPRAGVEALILGKPVVAFAVDGLREIVKNGENGFVLPPGQLDAMAEKIVQILVDSELQKTLADGATRSIDETFDIHYMVRRQEALYSRLLGAPEPPNSTETGQNLGGATR